MYVYLMLSVKLTQAAHELSHGVILSSLAHTLFWWRGGGGLLISKINSFATRSENSTTIQLQLRLQHASDGRCLSPNIASKGPRLSVGLLTYGIHLHVQVKCLRQVHWIAPSVCIIWAKTTWGSRLPQFKVRNSWTHECDFCIMRRYKDSRTAFLFVLF